MEQPLLLLHGALGSSASMSPLARELAKWYKVHTLSFSGHGGKAVEAVFSTQLFAEDVLRYLDEHRLEKVAVFGFSMGGYVALYLAAKHPERISKVVTLGTKLNWSPEVAAREVRMLDSDKIKEKVPQFADALAKRHQPQDWEEVVQQTRHFILDLGESPALKKEMLQQLTQPVVIGLGELDNMVGVEESREATAAIPNGRFVALQGMPHPIEKVNAPQLAAFLEEALS